MFSMDQKIYLVKDGSQTIVGVPDFDHLAEALGTISKMENVDNIHLFGQETYANKLAEEIYELYRFGNNNLKVEIN